MFGVCIKQHAGACFWRQGIGDKPPCEVMGHAAEFYFDDPRGWKNAVSAAGDEVDQFQSGEMACTVNVEDTTK
ncbi:hypothetical protein D3C85_1895570 [compost metagenome]